MGQSPTVSAAVIKNDFELAVELGASPEELEQQTGLERHRLKYSDERLPAWLSFQLCAVVFDIVKNTAFALHMGEKTDPKSLGIFGHIIMNCSTVRELLHHSVRYYKIARELTRLEMRETNNHVHMIFDIEAPENIKHLYVEKFFATSISVIRNLAQTDLDPVEVAFQHSPTSYLNEYERIFRCPLTFNHSENALVLNQSVLDIEFSHYNSEVKELLSNHAESLLSRQASDYHLQAEVQKAIIDHLHEGIVSIEMISERFNMSRWTLNRKLNLEGTSFQDILNQTRRELAVSYLENSQFSISEIGFLLGFSNPDSFPKAFKRWFGKTPMNFRQSSGV